MSDGAVEIIPFDKSFADDFARLNYQWIEQYFAVEEHDREMLDDPVEYIIKPGGQILMAIVDGKVAGIVALIDEGPRFELAKMAVSPEFRGKGIGDRLIQACVDHAIAKGKRSIFLLSNKKLAPAINLYRKHGFVETILDERSPYERVDIRMELAI